MKTLELAGQRIRAFSIGGIETCFQLPDYNLNLDIGRCPPGAEKQSTLLLTHGHIDHAAGLPYYVSMRGLLNLSPPRVFAPVESEPVLAEILRGWARLQSDSLRCVLTGVAPGESIPLSKERFARTFRSPHRIACVGYTVFRRIRRLRPDLVHLPEPAVLERARQGEQVHVVEERPEVCFPGDTTIEVLEREPTVTTARLLILECTFLAPKVSEEKAQRGGHVHFDQLAARAHHFRNEAILLTHFSRRHPRHEIEAAVREKLPASLRDRLHLLLHDDVDAG
jgi:ribonuclease Z